MAAAIAVRADDAADGDRLRRQDGQERRRARSGSTPSGSAPTSTGNTGATTEDADVGRFLRLFTELPLDEIARLEHLHDGEINEAKKVLATEATALCHGRAAAEAAAKTAAGRIRGRRRLSSGLPQIAVARDALARGLPAFELFVRAGLATSNGEARRLIKGGGARLNDAVITSETQAVSLGDLDAAGQLKLSAGRKRHVLVRLG